MCLRFPETVRRFSAILVADLRERTRSTRFWVVIALVGLATWWCFPSMDAGYVTVAIGDNVRGIYSSAWVGMVLGLLYSTMLSLIGFYLVRGTLVRDFDTRVWQLLVATPMTRSGYLLAKWASHLIVFASIMLVGLAVGGVAQLVRGEDRAFDLVELAKPVFVLALPALALTAFFAVLFDLLPWLRRTGGNVLFFFVWIFLFVSTTALIDPDKAAWARHTWFSDPNGLALAIRDLQSQLRGHAGDENIGTSALARTPSPASLSCSRGRTGTCAGSTWRGAFFGCCCRCSASVALAPALDWAAARTRTAGNRRARRASGTSPALAGSIAATVRIDGRRHAAGRRTQARAAPAPRVVVVRHDRAGRRATRRQPRCDRHRRDRCMADQRGCVRARDPARARYRYGFVAVHGRGRDTSLAGRAHRRCPVVGIDCGRPCIAASRIRRCDCRVRACC